MKLYHLTDSKNVESILKSGLDPSFSREHDGEDKYVYFSQDMVHAEGYENHHGDWDKSTLITIESENLDEESLGPDDVDLPDLLEQDDEEYREFYEISWQESLQISGQCTYRKIIPACLLKMV